MLRDLTEVLELTCFQVNLKIHLVSVAWRWHSTIASILTASTGWYVRLPKPLQPPPTVAWLGRS